MKVERRNAPSQQEIQLGEVQLSNFAVLHGGLREVRKGQGEGHAGAVWPMCPLFFCSGDLM